MPKDIYIKESITQEYFDEILDSIDTKLADKDTTELCEVVKSIVKYITPAKEAYILFLDSKNMEFFIPSSHYRTIPVNSNISSAIIESYKSKDAILINGIEDSDIYNRQYDNFLGKNIKDLLIVPILNSDSLDFKGLIFSVILEDDINQYIEDDIKYLKEISKRIEKYIDIDRVLKANSLKKNLKKCTDSYKLLEDRYKKEQLYTSSLIHDIRTPMNGIIGFLELLKAKEDDATKIDYIKSALQSSEDIIILINDALDMAKIVNGKMSVEQIDFSPFEKFYDSIKIFFSMARKKGIYSFIYFDPKIPKIIHSDFHRIKQIINNLLSNAIKFTPPDGKIFIDFIYDKSSDKLTISVRDNGIGISKESQKDIFSAYIQESSSTSREHGGTGLGLSISKELANLLGGDIFLESEKNRGSRFYFKIPCNTSENTPILEKDSSLDKFSITLYTSEKDNIELNLIKRYLDELSIDSRYIDSSFDIDKLLLEEFSLLIVSESDTHLHEETIQLILDRGSSVLMLDRDILDNKYNWYSGKVSRITPPLLPNILYNKLEELLLDKKVLKEDDYFIKDKSIFVIDDNKINLKFMREILKRYGAKVSIFADPREGVKSFKNSDKVDILFIDKNMPFIQGDKVIKTIRKFEKLYKKSPSKIVALTGDSNDSTKELFIDVGANLVLNKPVHINQLEEALRTLISQ